MNNELKLTMAFMQGAKALPVPVPHKSKGLIPGFDYNRRDIAELAQEVYPSVTRGNHGIGIQLAPPWVCVDLDAENQVLSEALALFLPNTPHVFGRSEEGEPVPRTHYLYHTSDEFVRPAVHRKIEANPHIHVDFLGGGGKHQIMPGSIHESGQLYRWVTPGSVLTTPVVTTSFELTSAIRQACAASMLADHWQPGVRHHMTAPIAGWLQTLKHRVEEAGIPSFALDETQALTFFKKVLTLAGDDEKDRVSRLKSFETSWEKGAAGFDRMTGLPRLLELMGSDEQKNALMYLMSDSVGFEELEEMQDRFAVWMPQDMVLDRRAIGRDGAVRHIPMHKFLSSRSHLRVMMGEKRVPAVKLWQSSDLTMRYDIETFHPGKSEFFSHDDMAYYNVYPGLAIPPVEYSDDPKDAVFLSMLDEYLLKVVCDGDKGAHRWVCTWLAQLFRNPAVRPGTALVLSGVQGAGKTFLGECLVRRVVGDELYLAISDINTITDTFNSHAAGRLFIQCDEGITARQRRNSEILKALVTDESMNVHAKFMNQYQQRNFARFLFTTNHLDESMMIDARDRRFTVLRVSDRVANNIPYWTKLRQEITKERLAQWHYWLLETYDDEDLVKRPHMTAAKVFMQQASVHPFDRFLYERACDGHPMEEQFHRNYYDSIHERGTGSPKPMAKDRDNWPGWVRLEPIVQSYNESIKLDRRMNRLNNHTLKALMLERELMTGHEPFWQIRVSEEGRDLKLSNKKIKLYQFPSMEKIKYYLSETHGFTFTESEGEDGNITYLIAGDKF